MKPVSAFSAAIMLVIAIAHLLRIVFQVPVVAGGVTLPMWPSGVIFVVLVVVALLLAREGRK